MGCYSRINNNTPTLLRQMQDGGVRLFRADVSWCHPTKFYLPLHKFVLHWARRHFTRSHARHVIASDSMRLSRADTSPLFFPPCRSINLDGSICRAILALPKTPPVRPLRLKHLIPTTTPSPPPPPLFCLPSLRRIPAWIPIQSSETQDEAAFARSLLHWFRSTPLYFSNPLIEGDFQEARHNGA